MAFAPTIWWLLVGRVINGLTSASFSTANAYVADITPPEDRARRFGLMGSAFGFGFLIGPVIGGSLGLINLRLPFMVAAGMALANGLYGLLILPESLPPERRMARFTWAKANPVASGSKLHPRPRLDVGPGHDLFPVHAVAKRLAQCVRPLRRLSVLHSGTPLTIGVVMMVNGGGGASSRRYSWSGPSFAGSVSAARC